MWSRWTRGWFLRFRPISGMQCGGLGVSYGCNFLYFCERFVRRGPSWSGAEFGCLVCSHELHMVVAKITFGNLGAETLDSTPWVLVRCPRTLRGSRSPSSSTLAGPCLPL